MKTIGKNKILAVISWIFAALVAFIIFRFSCDTGEESAEVSESLLGIIIEFIGRYIPHTLLRKIAHFCEFAALGFFVGGGFRFSFGTKNVFWPLIPCALYAASDEIHQIFVDGRAFGFIDIFIDSCGSLTGILVLALLIIIIEKIMNRKTEVSK